MAIRSPEVLVVAHPTLTIRRVLGSATPRSASSCACLALARDPRVRSRVRGASWMLLRTGSMPTRVCSVMAAWIARVPATFS